MSTPLVGIVVSTLCVFILAFLYRAERKRGKRFFEYVRKHFDSIVEKIEQSFLSASRYLGGAVLRQIIHYFFHSLLSQTARVLLYFEEKIQSLLRSNRLLAKRAHQERTTRNMLDEIAEHRASTAFSDEERKKRKEEALNSGQ